MREAGVAEVVELHPSEAGGEEILAKFEAQRLCAPKERSRIVRLLALHEHVKELGKRKVDGLERVGGRENQRPPLILDRGKIR